MTFELTGARVMAPYFGNSLYVWTSIIGVILAALTAGYWYGGRLADTRPERTWLAYILIAGSACLLLATLMQSWLLGQLATQIESPLLGSLLGTIILYGPTSFCLGMVSPFVARLVLSDSGEGSGAIVGRIMAAGSAGSILGTFLTGYILFSLMGSQRILLACAGLLALLAVTAQRRAVLIPAGIIVIAVLVLITRPRSLSGGNRVGLLENTDTAYNNIEIFDASVNQRPLRVAVTDRTGWQSAIYRDSDETVFPYQRAFNDLAQLKNSPGSQSLTIGGAVMTQPNVWRKQPDWGHLDIVEIDPDFMPLARKYFGYVDSQSVEVINQDGRRFLNQSDKTYNLIFIDAFSGMTVPPHLTTTEAADRLAKMLKPGGVLTANVVSRVQATKPTMVGSYARTLQKSFRYVEVWGYSTHISSWRQNMLVLASQSPLSRIDNRLQVKQYSLDQLPGYILTDDFSPVERLSID